MSVSSTTGRFRPSWRAMNADTDPWAEEIMLRFFQEAPAWRKLEMAGDLTKGMLQLAERGLVERNPQAAPGEIRRRLADLLLGQELAVLVYGSLIPSDNNEVDQLGSP